MEFVIPPSILGLSDSPVQLTEKTSAHTLTNFNPLSTGLKVRDGLYLWGRVPEYTGKASIHSFKGKFPNNPFNNNIVVCTSNSFYNVNFKEQRSQNGGRISTGAKTDSEADRLTIHAPPVLAGRPIQQNFSNAVSTLYTTPQASNLIICHEAEFPPIVLRDVGGETFINTVQTEVAGETNTTSAFRLGLIFPFEFQERLCFIEKDSLKIWYDRDGQVIPTALILNDFQVAADFKRGGTLYSVFTIGTDTGDGWKNFICFMTTEGEVAVYTIGDQGFGEPDAITLNDIYYIGKPLGPKAFFEINGDVFIATERGLLSFKAAMKHDLNTGKPYMSNKIWQRWKRAVDNYPGVWTITEFSSNTEDIVLVSPPGEMTFVYNTQTGAWSEWDIRVDDSTVLDNTLYILSDVYVYKYQGGRDQTVDNDAIVNNPIQSRWTPRFISLADQYKTRMKHARVDYTALTPIGYKPYTAVYETYQSNPPYPTVSPAPEYQGMPNEEPEFFTRSFKMNGIGKRICVGIQTAVEQEDSPNAQFQSIELKYDAGRK